MGGPGNKKLSGLTGDLTEVVGFGKAAAGDLRQKVDRFCLLLRNLTVVHPEWNGLTKENDAGFGHRLLNFPRGFLSS